MSKKSLAWQCRRGLLELDLVFQVFLDAGYEEASIALQEAFKALLRCADQEILAWLLGTETPPEALSPIITELRIHYASVV